MKRRFLKLTVVLLSAQFAWAQTGVFALDASNPYGSKNRLSVAPKSASALEDSFLKNIRLLQWKKELEILQRQRSDTRRGGAVAGFETLLARRELADPPGGGDPGDPPIPEGGQIYQWLSQNQSVSPLGLLASYPDDAGNLNQAFTYDQALSGIVLLKRGDSVSARKIFDFYYSQWDGSGFWTVYNSQIVDGSKIEYMKILGPTAWIGLFSLQYYMRTGDTRGRTLATNVGHWVRSLPHQNGGVAMGDSGIWATLYSVENNLSAYALLSGLSLKAATSADRSLFNTERTNMRSWFQTEAYDPATGLFRRGAGGDAVKAFDTNSWAVLVFGVANLQNYFGIDTDPDNSLASNLVKKTEDTFGVQPGGGFGGNMLSAKGFDFSDFSNAAEISRAGVKWVEGTNHMILVYRELYNYWCSRNSQKAAYYQSRLDYFLGHNVDNSILQDGRLAYTYADQSGVQVFADNPFWFTAAGRAIASTAWVYFSLYGINPFKI